MIWMLAAATMMAVAEPCDRPADVREADACAMIDYQNANARMDHNWQIASAALARYPQSAALRRQRQDSSSRAQKAWVAYREDHCESLHPPSSTQEGEYMLRLACQTRVTKERANELEQFARRLAR
jgi:uncharacterized protein YecT (DUF1311 family)